MSYEGIPLIILICYIFGEIYKVIFKKNKQIYKLIPLLVSLLGGLLGVILYKNEPSMILEANNSYVALLLGIISGASSTGANQIVKQVFMKGKDNNVSKE